MTFKGVLYITKKGILQNAFKKKGIAYEIF